MIDDADGKHPHEIGYRRPPKQTQFVKGQSGNPKGRPKGSRNFATVFQAELKRRVAVTEDGKRKKITKREAVAKQLVNKAAAGDPKAIPVLLDEMRPYETDAAGASRAEMMSPEDQAVMESITRRIREAENTSDAASSSAQSTTTSSEAAPPENQEGTPQ
jgi:Family of unknown function (DUF5681)